MDDDDSISVGKDGEESCSTTHSLSTTPQGSEELNPCSRKAELYSRNPTCALCRNHGIIKKLKGHKRYCQWRTCPCDLCTATNKKRKTNAAQVSIRRAIVADRELATSGEIMPDDSASITPTETPSYRKKIIATRRLSTPTTTETHRKEPSPINCSPARPPGLGGQLGQLTLGHIMGPVAFSQQVLYASFLLGQNVNFLVESLRDPRARLRPMPEIVPFVDSVIRQTKSAMEDVLMKLADANKELQNISVPEARTARYTSVSFPFGGDPSLGYPLPPYPYYPHLSVTTHTGIAAGHTSVITGTTNVIANQGGVTNTKYPQFYPYGSIEPLSDRRIS